MRTSFELHCLFGPGGFFISFLKQNKKINRYFDCILFVCFSLKVSQMKTANG